MAQQVAKFIYRSILLRGYAAYAIYCIKSLKDWTTDQETWIWKSYSTMAKVRGIRMEKRTGKMEVINAGGLLPYHNNNTTLSLVINNVRSKKGVYS